MTSKGSLVRKRKFSPLLHEILWTVRSHWWVSFVGLLLFFGFTLVAMQLSGNKTDTFSLIARDSVIAVQIAAVLYGLFAAFCLFRFLWNRAECGLYLAVGSARWKQFLIRYLFGFVSVVVAVVLPLLITYHTEMLAFGEDHYGISSHYAVVYTTALVIVALLSYTVSTLVAVLCGHMIPALLTAAGVLAAPYTLLYGIQQMLAFYLFGTPLGAASAAPYAENLMFRCREAGLFTLFSEQLSYFELSASYFKRNDTPDFAEIAEQIKAERVLPALTVILLFGVIAVLAILAGFAFCRRPTEHAGKHTVHPVLSHAVSLTVGIGGAAAVLSLDAPVEGMLGTVLLTALFIVVFVLAAALIRLILIRNFRLCVKHFPVLGGVAAFVLAVVICLGTGWFGYADYIPAAEDVQSVIVTANQHPDLFHVNGQTGFSQGMSYIYDDINVQSLIVYGFAPRYENFPVLTSADDIETARAIHEAVLASGRATFTGEEAAAYRDTVVPVHLYITYQLKNGKTVARYYPYLTLQTLEATMKLEDTEAFRTEIAAYHEDVGVTEYTVFEFGDPFFAKFTTPTLSEEEQTALCAALDADMAAQSMSERYFGTTDASGTQAQAQTQAQTQTQTVIGIIRILLQPADNGRLTTHPRDRLYKTYYITENDRNTLAFLEEKGLTSLFESEFTVTDVRTQRYTPRFCTDGYDRAASFVFFSCENVLQLYTVRSTSQSITEQVMNTTTAVPETEWAAYMQSSRAVALMTRPGLMVQITLTNADGEKKLVTRYLYDEDMPAS